MDRKGQVKKKIKRLKIGGIIQNKIQKMQTLCGHHFWARSGQRQVDGRH